MELKDTRLTALDAALDDSLCETCHSVVDLTHSVLMLGHRIVGCPACDWISSVALSA